MHVWQFPDHPSSGPAGVAAAPVRRPLRLTLAPRPVPPLHPVPLAARRCVQLPLDRNTRGWDRENSGRCAPDPPAFPHSTVPGLQLTRANRASCYRPDHHSSAAKQTVHPQLKFPTTRRGSSQPFVHAPQCPMHQCVLTHFAYQPPVSTGAPLPQHAPTTPP